MGLWAHSLQVAASHLKSYVIGWSYGRTRQDGRRELGCEEPSTGVYDQVEWGNIEIQGRMSLGRWWMDDSDHHDDLSEWEHLEMTKESRCAQTQPISCSVRWCTGALDDLIKDRKHIRWPMKIKSLFGNMDCCIMFKKSYVIYILYMLKLRECLVAWI